MGTPHGGSDIAFWMSYAANVTHAVSYGTRQNKNLVKVLRKDSTFLGTLSRKFVEQNEALNIITFYETKKLPTLDGLVRISRFLFNSKSYRILIRCPQGCG
jgi:hypothetical protein